MKRYMIVGNDITDSECTLEVGIVDSEDLAKRIVDKLNAENKDARKRWDMYGSKCTVGCEAFKSKNDASAVKALNECIEFECPFKKNIHLAEIFYGGGDHGEETSGGIEVVCDGESMWCSGVFEFKYSYHSVAVLSESDFETIIEENMR